MRLFVALDLPWTLRETLAGLCGGLPGADWRAPDTLHLTLRFIGETRPDRADEIDLALQTLRGRRLSLALSGVGLFDERSRPSALWAGIVRNERLDHLQAKIETVLQRAGVPAARRRFQPHVTLARVDGVAEPALAAWVQAHNLLRTEPVPVDSFTLFSSQPGPDQPVHIAEVDYALA